MNNDTNNNLTTIHANAVVIGQVGFLIMGKSGSGKSDLTLRIIKENGLLIGDDYVDLVTENNMLYAKAHHKLAGLIEIRSIGIVRVPSIEKHSIQCVINLYDDYERLPEYPVYQNINGIQLQSYYINPFEISAIAKINMIVEIYKNPNLLYKDE